MRYLATTILYLARPPRYERREKSLQAQVEPETPVSKRHDFVRTGARYHTKYLGILYPVVPGIKNTGKTMLAGLCESKDLPPQKKVLAVKQICLPRHIISLKNHRRHCAAGILYEGLLQEIFRALCRVRVFIRHITVYFRLLHWAVEPQGG